jgi:hypothetical protein
MPGRTIAIDTVSVAKCEIVLWHNHAWDRPASPVFVFPTPKCSGGAVVACRSGPANAIIKRAGALVPLLDDDIPGSWTPLMLTPHYKFSKTSAKDYGRRLVNKGLCKKVDIYVVGPYHKVLSYYDTVP